MTGFVDDVNSQKRESEWYNVQEGDNRFRILVEPQRLVQEYDQKTKKYKTAYEGSGYKGTPKYLTWILVGDELKLFKIPFTVAEMLRDLMTDQDYAFSDFPMPYDVNLKVKNAGTKEVAYTLIGSPKITLVSEEVLEQLEEKTSVGDVIEAMKDKQRKEDNPDASVSSTKVEYPDGPNPDDIPF